MSTILSTQPTPNDSTQQTLNTEPGGTTQAPTPQTTQQASQQTQGGGRGGRGGTRGGARGGRGRRATRRGVQQGTQSHRSWTTDQNRDGLSTLDLIVEWLTVEGQYDLWRNSDVSKREVDETINQYLIDNGGVSRAWKGIEQITTLEKKFRQALAYCDQTGQGILDEADERARQAATNLEDSETEDFVGDARTQTEAQIRKICKYFYELEPVMLDRPSAVPLNTHEQGDVDENLAGALNLGPNEDRPTTPDHWSNSERGGNASPVNTLGQPLPDLNMSVPTSNRATATATATPAKTATPSVAPSPSARVTSMSALASQRPDTQSQRRVSYAERITDRLFPSCEEMAAQTTAELDLNRDRLAIANRMVDANIQLVNALSQQLAPAVPPPGSSDLQKRQLELDVGLREVELNRTQAALEAERVTGTAFARAKMIQDFIRTGISPAKALNITIQLFASGSMNTSGVGSTEASSAHSGALGTEDLD
ncbi:hypothetical protein Pst134EA_002755 [Puccinia striiformis f. sp. tritici]|uniref:hypothetical protein n=1 Tax=Puccinia striiformis f. sp. tritici TaxID=168172 RepID=UPI00200815C4|nr:hypothetical protein Pst134EA_002755 [Puccinia striiformis f. sp. tritici]KAH9472130.1 hypothetical protein Pst134EA_002755 [Puccinia striiformis f. sp. tritici]